MSYTEDLLVIICLIFLISSCLTGCIGGICDDNYTSDIHSVIICNKQEYINKNIEYIGNNVFYFNCISKSFTLTLSNFSKEYDVIAMAPDNTGSMHGYPKGYIVVATKKEAEHE